MQKSSGMENEQTDTSQSTVETQQEEADQRRRKREERNRKWEQAFAARMRNIVPGLVLGNVKASFKREMLLENRITGIVSLSDGRWVWWHSITRKAGIPEQRHKWVQCIDSSTQDLLVYMSDICDFIEQMAPSVLQMSLTLPSPHESEAESEVVVPASEAVRVHCDLGISRSPTVIIAYLMRKYRAELKDVLAFVGTKQKVRPSSNFMRQLEIWDRVGYQVWEHNEKTVPKAPYQAYLHDRAALLKSKGLTGNEPLAPLDLNSDNMH